MGERYVENAVFIAPVSIDSTALSELKKNGFKDDEPIAVRFFQTLWKFRTLGNYSRININEMLTDLLKASETFHVYQIRDGEFIRLTEITAEE